MSELRWDPIRRDWTVTATHRMDRTFLPPKEYCPLCPTAEDGFPTEIPRADFEIVVFENRFPSFRLPPPEIEAEPIAAHLVKPASGICEVVVYTPEHFGSLATLSPHRVRNLVRVWQDRYAELTKKKEIKYILIFENRGEEVGVTLHHPHGQIYAFPYLPPVPERELISAEEYQKGNGRCLFCDVLAAEEADSKRVVCRNEAFTAFVPFAARYPYEVHIYSRRHCPSIMELNRLEADLLAGILQETVKRYDALFSRTFPYIMVIHQDKVNENAGLGHLHIEFYPPLRDIGKLKYLAGCEQGGGTFINDSLPEKKAAELRQIIIHK